VRRPIRREKRTNLGGCRPAKAKNDTVPTFAWPKEDKIRWIEWRIRELTVQEGKVCGPAREVALRGKGRW
jgi:hypothetical protein